ISDGQFGDGTMQPPPSRFDLQEGDSNPPFPGDGGGKSSQVQSAQLPSNTFQLTQLHDTVKSQQTPPSASGVEAGSVRTVVSADRETNATGARPVNSNWRSIPEGAGAAQENCASASMTTAATTPVDPMALPAALLQMELTHQLPASSPQLAELISEATPVCDLN